MATSVLLSCELNEQQLPPVIFVPEEIGVDGGFLVTSILGQRAKQPNNGTVLICFHQNFQHYASAGMRLGFNLNAARQSGSLVVIEPLVDISDNFFDSKYLNINTVSVLCSLLTQIEGAVENLKASKQFITIIIDNIGTLSNLGANEKTLLSFCEKLIGFSGEKTTVVMKLNTSNLYPAMCSNLSDWADSEIQIVKMSSGNFKEVSGKLNVIKKKSSGLNYSHKTLLYKVNDRNIKIFVPGEIGAK